jgi:hypothetical protein
LLLKCYGKSKYMATKIRVYMDWTKAGSVLWGGLNSTEISTKNLINCTCEWTKVRSVCMHACMWAHYVCCILCTVYCVIYCMWYLYADIRYKEYSNEEWFEEIWMQYSSTQLRTTFDVVFKKEAQASKQIKHTDIVPIVRHS